MYLTLLLLPFNSMKDGLDHRVKTQRQWQHAPYALFFPWDMPKDAPRKN